MSSAGLAMVAVALGALLIVLYGGALEPEHEEEAVERIGPQGGLGGRSIR